MEADNYLYAVWSLQDKHEIPTLNLVEVWNLASNIAAGDHSSVYAKAVIAEATALRIIGEVLKPLRA